MQHSHSEPPDLNRKTSRLVMGLSRKTSRLVVWAQEDVNITYAKMMYFCVFLAIGFTWNINAVVQGPTGSHAEVGHTVAYNQSMGTTVAHSIEGRSENSGESENAGDSGESDDTESKETWHQLFVTIVVIIGIALILPQLTKLRNAEKRRHRPIPAHMSIVIWFLGILTVITECWMGIRS